jgi:hypothetical protein
LVLRMRGGLPAALLWTVLALWSFIMMVWI